MTTERNLQAQFSDIDLLTGCFNLVSFAKRVEAEFGRVDLTPLTIIGIDVHQLRMVNRTRGYDHGDQLLRWLGIALRDEMGNNIYRISGDAFVIILTGKTTQENDTRARNLFERLNHQARQLDLSTPVVRMAVIHFTDPELLNTALVWKNLNEYMEMVDAQQPFSIFAAKHLERREGESIHAIELMAERILSLGYMLNVTFRLAYTDPVGHLPNAIATRRKLELTLAESSPTHKQFSLLMIDGDNLKQYNTVSYADGDTLVAQLSAVLMNVIRPGDFVGRWRFGDEFVIILPDTDIVTAVKIGDRARAAVQDASEGWLYPTTISIGIVHYPIHGISIDQLMDKAEAALKSAKEAGKNRTVVSSPSD